MSSETDGAATQGVDPKGVDPRVAAHETMLTNRLRKRLKGLRRWAKREGVSCYRVYDKDIPEIPVAIDFYGGQEISAAVVATFARRDEVFPPGWENAITWAIAQSLDIDVDAVHWRQRQRQKGADQYQPQGSGGERQIVAEGGHRFLVNLSDYLDTGLFLDHRNARSWVQQEAADKDVLNLYAYTGAFTVYGAAGGARSTTTVDLSATYLSWAKDNLKLNELHGPQHQFVRADVLPWLRQAAAASYDLVICDPPTFSNSKKMNDSWDIQRDHALLLREVMRVTRTGGTIYFSTNRRRFRPDAHAFARAAAVEEVTEASVPQDFRNRRIHRCWKISR